MAEKNGPGCWILDSVDLGVLSHQQLFWHLYRYTSRSAAEKAKGERGAVIEGLGKIWVFTLAQKDWHAPSGKHVATIGPVPFEEGKKYTAQYMEALTPPGFMSVIHTHPVPELWYTEAGESCLETPHGKQVGRKGVQVIVPANEPMRLTATGKKLRRSLVLVLHDSSEPWVTVVHDWTPKNLCGE